MHSNRVPRIAENTFQGSNGRGVRNLPDRPGRPNPYGVAWSERVWDPTLGRERRQVKSQYFPTLELRDAKAVALRKDRRQGALRTMSRPEVDDWEAFRRATNGAPWQDVVAGWRAHLHTSGHVQNSTKVEEHVATYLAELAAMLARKEIAKGTECHRRQKLRMFSQDYGELRVAEIQPTHVRDWLDALRLEEAGTHNNYLKILRAFFTHARENKLRPDNPCENVRPRKERQKEVGILTVPQIAQLLHTAATWQDAAGVKRYAIGLRRLAIETFAGVRFSSANRLAPEDIRVEDRGIRHPAASIKTERRQYVDGFPPVLFEWLAIAPDDSELTETQYMHLKSALFHVAQVPHPFNCIRHSFATYHLAARKNPGETAYLLCHQNQKKLWNHYKGNATAAEGRRWETITPATAPAIAQEWLDELAKRGAAAPLSNAEREP